MRYNDQMVEPKNGKVIQRDIVINAFGITDQMYNKEVHLCSYPDLLSFVILFFGAADKYPPHFVIAYFELKNKPELKFSIIVPDKAPSSSAQLTNEFIKISSAGISDILITEYGQLPTEEDFRTKELSVQMEGRLRRDGIPFSIQELIDIHLTQNAEALQEARLLFLDRRPID